MKALITTIAILLLSAFSFSQQGWFQQVVPTSNYLYSVFFVSPSTGWAVGQSSTVLKTTNGGTNWFPQTAGAPGFLYSVFFIDPNTGWTVGQSGAIRKTTDSGSSWFPQVSGFSQNYLYSVCFTDVNIGYICGSGGLIIKTTDGGTSWTQQETGVTNTLSCIFFPPSSTSLRGFACGGTASTGTVVKTSNGGMNWVAETIGSNWLFGIHFMDIQTGCAVGFNGVIYTTTNSGVNWIERVSGTSNRLVAVHFPDYSTGYSAGYSGTIIKTTDGGQNWFTQQSATTNNLWGVNFIDHNTGWAAGWNGTIVHTTNGGITYINKIGTEVPGEFKLHQNYPNPFNPATTIRFDVKSGNSNVKIAVFDVLGKEVAEVVNGKLAPGKYEALWDASAYGSGIYFCVLSAGDYLETGKMVLNK